MKRLVTGAAVAAGAGVLWRLRRRSRHTPHRFDDRLMTVTVNASPEEVESDERVREVLAGLDMDLRLQVRPAPGGRGAELAVRVLDDDQRHGLLARVAGRDPRQAVRRALREAKSLVETGEVLRVEETGTGRGGIGSKLVEAAGRRAGGEGRL